MTVSQILTFSIILNGLFLFGLNELRPRIRYPIQSFSSGVNFANSLSIPIASYPPSIPRALTILFLN